MTVAPTVVCLLAAFTTSCRAAHMPSAQLGPLWTKLAPHFSTKLSFHKPGFEFPEGTMAFQRVEHEDGAASVKFRETRHLPKHQVGPNYTLLFDGLFEASSKDGKTKQDWVSFVKGKQCVGNNWDLQLVGLLLVASASAPPGGDGECSSFFAVHSEEKGNASMCLGSDGVPKKLEIWINGAWSGNTNANFWSISATFFDTSLEDLAVDAFARPTVCTEGPAPAHCPFNEAEPTETVVAVHYTHEKGKDCGANNMMTNDLRGALTFGLYDWFEYTQVFNVTVHKGFAPIQDCNYHPDIGQMLCEAGARTASNKNSVGRSSCQYMEGQFMGQCTENALVGSWYNFPSVGECAPGWDVGFNNCTWKTLSTKVVETKCLREKCLAILETDPAPYPKTMPCLQTAIAECPDHRGPLGPTCFSKPDDFHE